MIDPDFGAVVQVARASLLGRLITWAASSCRAAWGSSAAVRMASHVWSPIASWSAATRLRFVALTMTWASIGYATSLFLLPRYAISGLPLVWVGTFVLACVVVASLSNEFVVAWRERFGAGQKSMP